jgi:hypothetical protein
MRAMSGSVRTVYGVPMIYGYTEREVYVRVGLAFWAGLMLGVTLVRLVW